MSNYGKIAELLAGIMEYVHSENFEHCPEDHSSVMEAWAKDAAEILGNPLPGEIIPDIVKPKSYCTKCEGVHNIGECWEPENEDD